MRIKEYNIYGNLNYIAFSLIVAVALMLGVMYVPEVREFDAQLLTTIKGFLSQFPAYIPAMITDFGRANYMLWPKITVCSVLISHKKYFKAFMVVFITEAMGFTLGFLKTFVHRERPCIHEGYSFPSGHAMTSMCLYGIVIYLILRYVQNKFWRYFLTTAFTLFIAMVCVSRLWLGVHYPIDVVAGLFFGFIFVNLYIIACKLMNM